MEENCGANQWLGANMAVLKKKIYIYIYLYMYIYLYIYRYVCIAIQIKLAILFLLLITLVDLAFVIALLYADIARCNRCCCFADECRLVFLSRMCMFFYFLLDFVLEHRWILSGSGNIMIIYIFFVCFFLINFYLWSDYQYCTFNLFPYFLSLVPDSPEFMTFLNVYL